MADVFPRLCSWAAIAMAGFAPSLPAQTLLSPMIPQFHRWQMEKAPEMVAAVAKPEIGARQVQFTVLMLAELDEKFRVQRWGAVWEKPKASGGTEFAFSPVNDAMRKQIRTWLAAGFKAAVAANLEIAVLCQVDAHGAVKEWRNFFDFDPVAKLEGWSYEEMLTITVLEALEMAVPPQWPLELAMEGEMGRSLFTHPESWQKILNRAKARGTLRNIKIGISANYENCLGQVKPSPDQQRGMNELIRSADFIGISCYARVSVPPKAADFSESVRLFAAEFAGAGCPIPPDKPIRFTEIGLGGGGFNREWKLQVPSPSPDGMAKAAFFGTDDVAKNPWAAEANRNFRRQWHRAALDFLSAPGQEWKVTSAYLWSFGSFDVHGFEKAAFRDEEIVRMIREHNRSVRTAPPDASLPSK